MLTKTNLRRFAKIVGIVILTGVFLTGFATIGQGDVEFQELRTYEVTHQPKIKHFYSNY